MIVSAVLLIAALFLTVKKASSTTALINAILAIVMVFGCIAVPKMEEKERISSRNQLRNLGQQ